ncbi:hypothetical protein KKH30_03150 [Candidatus Micrarchaeota archaeon]|nr:hypothetical protein [Candidatus Micrarchaeota archaeon]MBU1939733.1 hypothetical protein [Candidatus Micrarchaeota archaeon]
MLNCKGFIGPIGDDLPSLIPLLFALMIFFSTFTFAFSVFDEKSRAFSRDLKVLEIARVLRSDGYISGAGEFGTLCSSLNIAGLEYSAGITDEFVLLEGKKRESEVKTLPAGTGVKFFEIEYYSGDDFKCTNTDTTPADAQESGGHIVARVYPIAVEDDMVVKPMHLVVIAWG